ncbi:MAG TPA: hypothetical protein PLJ97_00680 [Candidatus Saccharibacteria bacterium]|nr:hypothetical protein [Candidatus Saccharibacteria bacterium]
MFGSPFLKMLLPNTVTVIFSSVFVQFLGTSMSKSSPGASQLISAGSGLFLLAIQDFSML